MQEANKKNNESLLQQKRARLILQLNQNNDSNKQIKRRANPDFTPLSYAQEPLWIKSQLEPDNPVYNVAGALELQGFLNMEALQQSLDEIIRRHEILRSRFVMENGRAGQRVTIGKQLSLIRLDLDDLEPNEQLKIFHDCSDDFIRSPFDLTADLPLRAMLTSFGQQKHILLLTLHHIVSDRWSVGILMHELAAHYKAFSEGQPSSLPELKIHYGDFSAWQREQVEETEKHLRYWRQKLDDAAPLLELPIDYPRPPAQSYRGDHYSFELPQTLSMAIKTLAKQYNATLFMVLAAALNTLFYRYTGSKDIAIGYTSAGRSHAQIENLIGFFVNTLVLRNQFQDDLTFSGLLKQIREQALEDQAHQEVSFGQLVEVVNPVRNSSHAPIFQVMVTVQNAPTKDIQLAELNVKAVALESQVSEFDLTYLIEEKNGKLHGIIEYSTDLFNKTTLVRMTGHLETLLEGVVINPNSLLNQLPLLTKNEHRQLLSEWNHSTETLHSAYQVNQPIHQLFEAQAQALPDKTALIFASEEVSYRELNSCANQLAQHLLVQGIVPESRVGISAERSVELIIALLAVLKVGAAYVPIDPDYPDERLNYIISDAGIEILLTQSFLLDKFRYSGCHCINIDESYEHYPLESPTTSLALDNAAYLIYTSGSTGQPKGVVVSHRNLLHSTLARVRYYQDPLDCFLLLSSFAFDSSVAGIFWALSQGARLCLPESSDIANPTALAQLIHQQQVSHLLALPSFYKAVINDSNIPLLSALKTVIVAGEACAGDIAVEHHCKLPGVKFYNEYGPTEATVWSSVYQSMQPESNGVVPIGRPIENVQLYILDEQCQPVPIGVGGELFIGGVGLAKGYLNQPALTAEKFIPNPFSVSGQRLYRTGDLARYRTDSNIEFLGRIDHQVKIRGYRIELGEIEALLASCDGIDASIVVVREDQPGNKRLVAYLTAYDVQDVTASKLRSRLLSALPEYMIPSAFVILEALPLTANGKLDRQALPSPEITSVVTQQFVAPNGSVEITLARLWQELLGIEQVGRYDNFFELGGHSLLVVSLIERLQNQGKSVDVQMVFSAPVLADMAEAIRDSADTEFIVPENRIPESCMAITPEMLPLVDLSQDEIDGIVRNTSQGITNIQDIYPLAPLQQGILFHHLLGIHVDAYLKRAILSFDNRNRLDSFLKAFQIVIDRHDILRSSVFWEGLSQPVQVVHRQALLPIKELTVTENGEALSELLSRTELNELRMDLHEAPLFKAFVISEPCSERCLLALINHHMVDDNYTLQLILAEIQQILQGQKAQLPVPLPYRNFIAQLLTDTQVEHEAYFRAQLGDMTEPTAPFGLLNIQGEGEQVTESVCPVDISLSQRIRSVARQQGVSAAVLFHVAWALVLARCVGREDVVFGTVLLGRMQSSAGAGRVLGMFINTLPLRVSMAGCSVSEAVNAAHCSLRSLLEHEQASLVIAQRCSGVDNALPLFTSLFNYRHSDMVAAQNNTLSDIHTWEGIKVLRTEERTNYPIDISVDDTEQGFSITAQCVEGIDPGRIAGYLHAAIEGLANALANDPGQPISSLAVLPGHERQQLLIEFNGMQVGYPQDKLVHQLFERQAQQTPDATALVYECEALTYGELNRRANQLAHFLHSKGIKPDLLVGICLGRSFDMVIAVLAVLKTGGAYLPFDADLPAERLAYMAKDSQAALLLTQGSLLDALSLSSVERINITAQAAEIGEQSTENPNNPCSPQNLAYVIYTSGSTNYPKAVMVSHASLANAYHAWKQAYHLGTTAKGHLQMASFSFDVCTGDWVRALLSGDKLVICPRPLLLDAQRLYQLMRDENIEVAEFVPAVLRNLVAYLEKTGQSLDFMSLLICGSDAWTQQEYNKFRSYCGSGTRLINSYGLTEATIDSLYYESDNEDGAITETLPIGRPYANTRAYILDKALNPVPLGIAGELYLAGNGLARGYLNHPGSTAEKFIPDPFASQAGSRLYKTGDTARYLADGNIEFLGRNDFQVKIRGFRIELGEVEAQLGNCPGVREAVVIAREDSPGDKRLVAYLLAQDNTELSAADLRRQLATVLAEHQLPSAYVTLKSFPLTPNGKLDRKALPMPGVSAVASRGYEAPQGPMETAIAQIWQELLNLEQVSRHDNFFELGGHSLLAVQMVSRLRQEIGEVPLNEIFAHPTLREFVFAITAQSNANKHNNLVSIRPRGTLLPLFLIHPRGGNVNYARSLLQWLDADLPIYGINANGFVKDEIPLTTVEEMAALYIQAIRSVQPNGPYRIVGYSSGGPIAYEMASQLLGADENVEFVGLIDASIELKSAAMKNSDDFDECKFLLQELQDGEIPISSSVTEELKVLAVAGDFDEMLERCHFVGLIPQEVDSMTLRRYLAVYHANDLALAAYSPAPISIALNLFAATENNSLSDDVYGWEALVGTHLQTIPIGGDHSSIVELPHIETLGKAISKALKEASEKSVEHSERNYSPLILIQNGRPGTLPLFCVPGAGAGVTPFFELSQALDSDLPVYGLQPRGLDGKLVPHIDVQSTASAYIRAIREISPTGPYRLMGHSFGGWVAFEMALQLTESGEEIDTLIALDSEAPSLPGDKKQRYSRIDMLLELVSLYELNFNRTLGLTASDFSLLDNEQQLELLLSRLIEMKLMPPRTTIETLRGIVRVFEINLNADYTPKNIYSGVFHLVGIADNVNLDIGKDKKYQELISEWQRYAPKINFWESLGNHVTILNPPHVLKLAEWLNPLLKMS